MIRDGGLIERIKAIDAATQQDILPLQQFFSRGRRKLMSEQGKGRTPLVMGPGIAPKLWGKIGRAHV